MSYDRNDVLMMARIKNEENWIGRNLERTWKVCGKVLIWDDGSTDGTEATCLRSVGGEDERMADEAAADGDEKVAHEMTDGRDTEISCRQFR